MEDEAGRIRRKGRAGLVVAAVCVTVLGLGGPIMIAVQDDPSPVLPFYPVLWAIAIGGILYWLSAFRRAMRKAREE